jgi:ATP-binding cassette, subfamily B, bacterial MsbA
LIEGSIRDNILFHLDVNDQKIREAATEAFALEFIEDPSICPQGFDTILGTGGVTLSNG